MHNVFQAAVAGADGSICCGHVALLLIDCIQFANFLYRLLSKTNLLHDVLDVGVRHLFLRYVSSMIIVVHFLCLRNGRPGIELVDARTELEQAHGVLVLGKVLVLVLEMFALWRQVVWSLWWVNVGRVGELQCIA